MSTTHPPVRVDIATLQGSGPSMQDRVFQTPNAVILLDGASDPDASEDDGGWYAEQLGQHLVNLLSVQPFASLQEVLANAIASITAGHGLTPGASPSTTVAMARWSEDLVDVLVLGDSPVVIQYADGTTQVVEDRRLDLLPGRERFHLGSNNDTARLERWRSLVAFERASRNKPDGYWIAEADPAASEHALVTTIRRIDAAAILVVSDGVAVGINTYKVPATWNVAISLARSRSEGLVQTIHATELSDPECERWPRVKLHDDKAAALVVFRDQAKQIGQNSNLPTPTTMA